MLIFNQWWFTPWRWEFSRKYEGLTPVQGLAIQKFLQKGVIYSGLIVHQTIDVSGQKGQDLF